jgi:hypothetical protein
MYPDYDRENAYGFLDWIEPRVIDKEREWFLNKYFSDYRKVLDCLADLTTYVPTEWDFGAGQRRRVHEKLIYTVADVAHHHGVSVGWIERNVTPLINPEGTNRSHRSVMRRAGAKFAVDLAERHPLLPTQLIAEEVQMFVPEDVFSLDYLRQQIFSKERNDLVTDSRTAKSRQLSALRVAGVGGAALEAFIDGCYS